VLTSLAGAPNRLPRDVDDPIERDKVLRRNRIEPVAAELLLGAVERACTAGVVAGRGPAGALACRPDRRGTSSRLQDQVGVDLDA
jgi:hypothetical protein